MTSTDTKFMKRALTLAKRVSAKHTRIRPSDA